MARARSVVGVAILLFGFVASASAQGTGDIVGRVVDSSGGALPGVSVTAMSLATSITRSTVTSDTGDYTFTLLPIGNYEVMKILRNRRPGSEVRRRRPRTPACDRFASSSRSSTRPQGRMPGSSPPLAPGVCFAGCGERRRRSLRSR